MTKTALDLTPAEWRNYRLSEALENRERKADNRIELHRREAWGVAARAAQLLREEFGAQKVVVFGSLIHEKGFSHWSDIDLAAYGIPVERFYSAVADVTGLSSKFKVDLVDVDDCRPTLKKIIKKEGREI